MVDISEVLLDLGLSDSVTDEERAIVSTSIRRAEAAIKRFLGYDPYWKTRTEYYPQRDFSMSYGAYVWEVNDTQAYQRHLSEAVSDVLIVQHLPIRSITSLYIDYDGRAGARTGSFSEESKKTEGVDYWPDYNMVDDDGNNMCLSGMIRSEGMWPSKPGTVKIVYTSGYTAKELRGQCSVVDTTVLLEATVDEAVRRAKKVFLTKKQTGRGFIAGTMTSESLGDYSYSIEGSSAASQFGGQYDLLGSTMEKLNDFVNWGYRIAG
jgi:hypothetical protein